MSLSALRTVATRRSLRVAHLPRFSGYNVSAARMRLYSTTEPSNTPPPTGSQSEPKEQGSKTWAYAAGVGGVALLGLGYYFISQSQEGNVKEEKLFVPTKDEYQKVYNAIADILEENSEYDDGSYGPVLVRLAWHSAGTFDKETKTGGSNYATMRFIPESSHGANNGLDVARTLMEKVKKRFSWISYGDLWTLGGVCAIQEMGGPKIPWRPGRVDGYEKDATPDGRLPDATQGSDHLRKIFYRMGFNDQEIVALSGAHVLGRCHPDRSGFSGPWSFSPTTFSNEFFRLLLNETWVWKKWSGPKQYEDKKTKSLMMLPTDYVLTQDKSFKKYTKAYADSEELFFKDFAAAFSKLLELGIPTDHFGGKDPWAMMTTAESEELKEKK